MQPAKLLLNEERFNCQSRHGPRADRRATAVDVRPLDVGLIWRSLLPARSSPPRTSTQL